MNAPNTAAETSRNQPILQAEIRCHLASAIRGEAVVAQVCAVLPFVPGDAASRIAHTVPSSASRLASRVGARHLAPR